MLMHNRRPCAAEQVFATGSDKTVSTVSCPSGPLTSPSSDWHRADIIAALHKSGTTVVGLSRASGLSPSSLSNVFYRSWPRGERIIAAYLNVPLSDIWPSRYPACDAAVKARCRYSALCRR